MNLDKLFEYIVPLIIFAIFILRGLFGGKPDPIDSFEPPPSDSLEPLRQKREVEQVLQTYYGQDRSPPQRTVKTGPETYDEVTSRPERLDTSSFRRQRGEQEGLEASLGALGAAPELSPEVSSPPQGVAEQGSQQQSLRQLRAQAAKLNREKTHLQEISSKSEISNGSFKVLSPLNIRRSAREIFLLKELLDRPLSLRPPSNTPN